MTEAMIKALEAKGFKRWARGEHDRLYANPENFGLEVERYKTGNICYAAINGEVTSNNFANKILANMKVYIDLNTDKLVVSPYYNEDIMDNINAAIEAAKEETAPKEEKPMRKICENNIFGIEPLPDFTGWENMEISEPVFDTIITMDETEIRTAYETEAK